MSRQKLNEFSARFNGGSSQNTVKIVSIGSEDGAFGKRLEAEPSIYSSVELQTTREELEVEKEGKKLVEEKLEQAEKKL